MSEEMRILKRLYERFNARDIDSVLAVMHQDVMWANGMEGTTCTDTMEFAPIGIASGH